MQLLLTAGLAHEKSSRATNMVYTQMLFALAFDKLVWGINPVGLSVVGGMLILGAAIYVAVHKDSTRSGAPSSAARKPEGTMDEEEGLVAGMDEDEQDDGSDVDDVAAPEGYDQSLRDVEEVQLKTIRA